MFNGIYATGSIKNSTKTAQMKKFIETLIFFLTTKIKKC